jgi:electron transfer flavoprotein beta subunit
MNVLVSIKRIPLTGEKIVLTEDEQGINTKYLGFAASPHEECAAEEAVRIIEKHGGSSTVLTLGTEEAIAQMHEAMAIGIDQGILLETDGREWGATATAKAIASAARAQEEAFDMLLFGNESGDINSYQVGIRVAQELDLPCVTGVKKIEIEDGKAVVKKEVSDGWEVYEVPLPAVFTVKEGINVPRYPPMIGKMKAKKKPLARMEPEWMEDGVQKIRLKTPEERGSTVEILGEGVAAVPRAIEVLKEIGVIQS